MAISIAAEWEVLNNRYYRKQEIYTMCWNSVDLSRHKVACSKFGGPVAMVRDESKMVQLKAESARAKLLLFTSSGKLLSSVPWDRPGGRLIALGWTDEEVLLAVVHDGTIFQYNIHGELIPEQLSLGQECWNQGVAECIIWGSGLVVLTEQNQLFSIPNLETQTVVKLADPLLEDPPHCMAVVEPQYTLSGNLEVLLAVGSSVLMVDAENVRNQMVDFGPIQKMTLSSNGNLLACFTHDGRLLVVYPDFSKSLLEHLTESALPPEQLVWCGVDSVLLYWEEELVMVGPYGDAVRWAYDEPIVLIPECDGVRILSNTFMEFLRRVPDSTVSIFKIGSTSPAAMLFDALEQFDKRSAKADENIRLISDKLPDAVGDCIDAAGHEFDISLQRTLLRAAAYGRAFCRKFDRDQFQDMCRTLRVLNAVRQFEIGIPLSIQQFKDLTAPVLIARLVNAHRHLLALRISEYLDLSKEVVLVHWACTKIIASSDVPDSVLLELLLEKLKACPGISYATVAADAHRNGRQKLAALLLDYEPRASEQVPLLTSMGEGERALVKAIESGDTNLVYFSILHLWRQRPLPEFFRIVQAKTLARNLFIAYARQNDPEILKKFFISIGQIQSAAEVFLKESWSFSRSIGNRSGSALQGPRLKTIDQAADLYAQTKEHMFERAAAEEQGKLLKLQQEFEISTGQLIFVDSSVSDTIRTLITLGNHRAAQRVKVDFKVPDKRFYWLKVFALATAKQWEALEKFSKEKKPPIGYKPFVEACIEEEENAEALKYIAKLTDPQERAEAYARIGMEKEATEAAAQAKDSELLGRLKITFGQNTAAGALFDTLRDRLSLT
ncbi:hypothetical protein KC19_10G014100 [Ceratodon purpureus]|uniref:Protein VACUOLELESS1 n=2 Tax=Ceratodon purpureus TaxID=3225 RepID=A0A8T0GI60_CERPU|nr:hypothetical protein KC19_10G014100 [Ceratodon purpureus]KAG0558249.1 hypothetical protein KC19_10G014100 [Ceratodon purpureus]